MSESNSQNKAIGEIVDLIANSLGTGREVHSATAISTCARLSGSFLFRSLELNTKDAVPGTTALSEEANQNGPKLISLMISVLNSFGIEIDNDKTEQADIASPEIGFLKSISKTQDGAIAIMNKYNFGFSDMANICTYATAFIIEQCKNDIAIENGFNTAVYGIIEGSKTIPPKANFRRIEKKRWYKFW